MSDTNESPVSSSWQNRVNELIAAQERITVLEKALGEAQQDIEVAQLRLKLSGPPKCVWADCQNLATAEVCVGHARKADRERGALRARVAQCVEALHQVDAQISCPEVRMDGTSRYVITVDGQQRVQKIVQAALDAQEPQ